MWLQASASSGKKKSPARRAAVGGTRVVLEASSLEEVTKRLKKPVPAVEKVGLRVARSK